MLTGRRRLRGFWSSFLLNVLRRPADWTMDDIQSVSICSLIRFKNTDCGFVPRRSPQTPAVTWNTVDSIKHCFYRSLCLWSLMLPLVLPAAGGACDVRLQALQALSSQSELSLPSNNPEAFYANFARNPFNNSWLEDRKELKVSPQSPKQELMLIRWYRTRTTQQFWR